MVDLDSGKPVASWPLGESPEGFYISTDGKLLAAAVEEDNSVALLQASDGKTLAHIKVEGENPEHAVFSPDSKWLYVRPKMPNRST